MDFTFVPQKQNSYSTEGQKGAGSSISEFQRKAAAINTLHNILMEPAGCVLRLSENKAPFFQIKSTILPLICVIKVITTQSLVKC